MEDLTLPDRLIRIATALVVVGVAIVAAVVSYEQAYEPVRTHGEDGWTARLVPCSRPSFHWEVAGRRRRNTATPSRPA